MILTKKKKRFIYFLFINIRIKAHYVYICKKKDNADEILAENFQRVYYELEKLELMEDEDDMTNEDD